MENCQVELGSVGRELPSQIPYLSNYGNIIHRVDSLRRMAEAEIPVTMSEIITADVTEEQRIFNEHRTAVMEGVRRAICGK